MHGTTHSDTLLAVPNAYMVIFRAVATADSKLDFICQLDIPTRWWGKLRTKKDPHSDRLHRGNIRGGPGCLSADTAASDHPVENHDRADAYAAVAPCSYSCSYSSDQSQQLEFINISAYAVPSLYRCTLRRLQTSTMPAPLRLCRYTQAVSRAQQCVKQYTCVSKKRGARKGIYLCVARCTSTQHVNTYFLVPPN